MSEDLTQEQKTDRWYPDRPVKEVWMWMTDCWKCRRETPVVCPKNGPIAQNRFGETVSKLPLGNVKKVYSNTLGKKVYGNVCVNCSAYQGNHYVKDERFEVFAAYQGQGLSRGEMLETAGAELVGKILIEEDCEECGRPVERLRHPYYLCEVCANEGEAVETDICEICGSYEQPGETHEHHTSYRENETMTVCTSCHAEIHHSDDVDERLVPDVTREEAERRGWL